MALARFGAGIVEIRGSLGGVYFTRDKSGNHISTQPRVIKRRTAAQDAQRRAFAQARTHTKNNRWVSYYIYRALNNLPFIYDTKVTGSPSPNCKGKYTIGGQHNGEDYYQRADSAWYIWWDGGASWVISQVVGVLGAASWFRVNTNHLGPYLWGGGASGTPTVGLHLQPPPLDFQIPHMQGP